MFSSTTRIRTTGAAVVAAAALAAAGCGSSSSTTSTAAGAAAAPTSTASVSNASAKGVAIATTKGAAGTYLTGESGRALYLWVADTGAKSSCSGACAQAWPPVVTKGKPIAGHGAQASDLATIKRSDGTRQVTYKDHPLYYFAGDPSSGTTSGQGNDGFGAKWWLVNPAGAAIASGGASSSSGGGSATPAASSSSSSAAGGGWS